MMYRSLLFINHAKRRWHSLAALALWVCLVPGAGAMELEKVLSGVAVTPPARTCFTEQRHNPLFKEPLVLSGYLEYLGPGQLAKVIESPFKESLLIEDGSIQVHRDGETRKLSLSRNSSVASMLKGIESIMSGDLESLRKTFRTDLSGTESDWELKLDPKSRRLSRFLQQLTVTGSAEAISSIRFNLQNGEWHLMTLGDEAVLP